MRGPSWINEGPGKAHIVIVGCIGSQNVSVYNQNMRQKRHNLVFSDVTDLFLSVMRRFLGYDMMFNLANNQFKFQISYFNSMCFFYCRDHL
jgi:arginine exporter protein ArgO